jgi:hypothetical protein
MKILRTALAYLDIKRHSFHFLSPYELPFYNTRKCSKRFQLKSSYPKPFSDKTVPVTDRHAMDKCRSLEANLQAI